MTASAGAPAAAPLLAARGLVKRYGSRQALAGLSLEVRAGEAVGLLGPNGAGKSTFVRLLTGAGQPDAGTIQLDGVRLGRRGRRRLGVAPQDLALYLELSGEENLRFFGQLHGLTGRRLAARVAEVLDLTGLTDRARSRVSTWSGGMQRRLNLAAALVHEPDLLVLDEPTVGVDPQSRNRILDDLVALRAQGLAILYTTHRMDEAQRLCDRVGILAGGRLLALDSPRALIAQHGGASRLAFDDGQGERWIETADPLAELRRLADRVPLAGLRLEQPDLERVFLNLTGRRLQD